MKPCAFKYATREALGAEGGLDQTIPEQEPNIFFTPIRYDGRIKAAPPILDSMRSYGAGKSGEVRSK
jgi:hypothetical protein